jgi:secondary thiamine-phosphate synthase enzyme
MLPDVDRKPGFLRNPVSYDAATGGPMETLTPPTTYRHATIRITTERPTVFMDLTSQVQDLVSDSGVRTGFVNIQTMHTTSAIVVNEHEPLLLSDFVALLEQAAPRPLAYRHDDVRSRTVNVVPGERPNGHAHCRALLLCPSACLNIADRRLQLGRWQRIFLAELDGPRLRDISILIVGEGGR